MSVLSLITRQAYYVAGLPLISHEEDHDGEEMHPQGERGKVHCKLELVDIHEVPPKTESSDGDR